MITSEVRNKLQSWSRVLKYLVFTESFLGEESAKFAKRREMYESLEKRQSKDNPFKWTTEVLEAAKHVKKAEGVTFYKVVNFPAQKTCLHVR
jgi:hypothetical protein